MTALPATLAEDRSALRPRTEQRHPSLQARCAWFFGVWLLLRTIVWTVLAALQPNPPLDAVEWFCWGRYWQLGYHKHPPLGAWLGEIGRWATPGSFVGGYLVGFLCVALALWSVWRLALTLLPPRPALAAVLCLDGLIFLGPASAEYSNYMPHIAFWALTVWLCHRAFTHDSPLDWLLVGLAGGLAMLSKYSTALLLICLAGHWLVNCRRRWRGPVIAILSMAIVCLPHAVWLVAHDFPTRRWVMLRGQGESGAFNHHASGLLFLAGQGLRLLPVLAILLPLIVWRRREAGPSRADRVFLLTVVLGPVLLHVAASLLAGLQLRDGWGTPLWTFAGLFLLAWFQTDDSSRAWRRFLCVWGVIALAFPAGFAAMMFARERPLRIHFPGRQLADEITARYELQMGKPPAVIAGDWWLAGNICLHSPSRPDLYGSLEPMNPRFAADRARIRLPERHYVPDPLTSPWTGDADLLRRGGVLVWDASAFGDEMPVELRGRYPSALPQSPVERPYLSGKKGCVRVGWAILE